MTMPKGPQRKLVDIGELLTARSGLPRQPVLAPGVAACLGERLRACYAHVMKDPVPDAFGRIFEAMDGTKSANNGH
jgi:hypothetical protein